MRPELSGDTRYQLEESLADILLSSVHDMERDEIFSGYEFKGLNNMSDLELVQRYIHCCYEWDDLVKTCLSELGADAVVKGIPVPEFDMANLNYNQQVPEQNDVILNALFALRNQFNEKSTEWAEITPHIDKRIKELTVNIGVANV